MTKEQLELLLEYINTKSAQAATTGDWGREYLGYLLAPITEKLFATIEEGEPT